MCRLAGAVKENEVSGDCVDLVAREQGHELEGTSNCDIRNCCYIHIRDMRDFIHHSGYADLDERIGQYD
jgi:hypothetical protein